MAGWRAKAAGTVAAIALLLAVAAGIAHAMFDGDYIKAIARDRVQAAWSRELAIDTLSLQLFPVPGVRATGVALSGPPWAQDAQLAAADRVEVRLSWRSLLSGKIAPGALRIEGARLMLERAADGRCSWDLDSKGERHGAIDWRNLVRLDAEKIDIQYRDAAAAPRSWHIPALSASASPNWRQLRLNATLVHAQQTVTVEGSVADLSRLGMDGAATEGSLSANWPSARLLVEGRLPLAVSGGDYAASVALEAQSPAELLRFFDIDAAQPPGAPLSLKATLKGAGDSLVASALQVKLGHTEASGELAMRRENGRLRIEGQIASPDIDWTILTREAGRPPPPPIPEGELFRHAPLAWGAVDALKGIDSAVTVRMARLRLRSGIQITDVAAQLRSHDDKVELPSFSMQLLGGKASGNLKLDGKRRSAQLQLAASGVLLERYFSERARKVPVSGGPMQIDASLNARGGSLREMAATMGGTAAIRGGSTLVRSEKAGQAESLLTSLFPLFSESNAPQLKLECFAARLPFSNGRAGSALVGARSEVSQLLTSGMVDMKRQSVDLRGRVRARSGVSIGLAALTGDVSISGPLRKPKMALDPVGTPSAVARLGAAIVTGGLSLLATAAWDAANPGANPCEAVFTVKD
ncbi:MAG: AsmA family protein [Noviherbaspirillum sp.]